MYLNLVLLIKMNYPKTKDAAAAAPWMMEERSYLIRMLISFSKFLEWEKKKQIKSNVLQFIWMSFIRSAPSASLDGWRRERKKHHPASQPSQPNNQPSSTIKTLQFVMHINKTNQIKENERKCVFFIFITLSLGKMMLGWLAEWHQRRRLWWRK